MLDVLMSSSTNVLRRNIEMIEKFSDMHGTGGGAAAAATAAEEAQRSCLPQALQLDKDGNRRLCMELYNTLQEQHGARPRSVSPPVKVHGGVGGAQWGAVAAMHGWPSLT